MDNFHISIYYLFFFRLYLLFVIHALFVNISFLLSRACFNKEALLKKRYRKFCDLNIIVRYQNNKQLRPVVDSLKYSLCD